MLRHRLFLFSGVFFLIERADRARLFSTPFRACHYFEFNWQDEEWSDS